MKQQCFKNHITLRCQQGFAKFVKKLYKLHIKEVAIIRNENGNINLSFHRWCDTTANLD